MAGSEHEQVADLDGSRKVPMVFQVQEFEPEMQGEAAATRLSLVRPSPAIPGPYQRFGKRAVDVVVGSALIAICAPILLTSALMVRLSLGKGVLFRQERIGLNGQAFVMIKFRTMQHSRRSGQRPFDGEDRRQTHKTIDDPRHTRVGVLLRKTSIDELPQLLHVVRGEMSLVGPRPELSNIVDRYGLRAHRRHTVRPGLTGAWQITHRNNGTHLHECFDGDLEYVDKVSLRNDVSIMRRTVAVVLSAKGM